MPHRNGSRRPIAYEEIMSDPIVAYLRQKCHRFAWQVPALGGRIDFVGVRPSYEVIAVEVKSRRWKKALLQAHRYMLCADKAYVALPEEVAERVASRSSLFHDRGVGLMKIGDSLEILIGAKPSWTTVPGLRQYILHVTKERRYRSLRAVSELVEAYDASLKLRSDCNVSDEEATGA